MDEINNARRGAIKRGFGLAAGGAIALGGLTGNTNPMDARTPPRAAQNTTGAIAGTAGEYYGDKVAMNEKMQSPEQIARHQLTRPIYEQMEKLERTQFGANLRGYWKPYQQALRSTSDHWKSCVANDRYVVTQSKMDQLRDQLHKIHRLPSEYIDQALNEGIAEILAAITEA